MLRIRIGQHWKHEGAADAMDGFGLELDGIALVPGASEEPLAVVMEQVLSATAALATGETVAAISLPESAQHLLLVRRGEHLVLHVLSLGRPAGPVRRAVSLEADEWRAAAVRAGRAWSEDLRPAGSAPLRRKVRSLLARAERAWTKATLGPPGWGLHLEPQGRPGFRLQASDPDGFLGAARSRRPVPLAVLALPGQLQLVGPEVSWEVAGPSGFLALELLRQAEDVVRALEMGERTLRLFPAGAPVPWELNLTGGTVSSLGLEWAWPAADMVQALVAPARTLAALLPALEPGLLQNRYLMDMTERAQSVLAALRGLFARPSGTPTALRRAPRTPPARPLHPAGSLRRLGFQRRGQLEALAEDGEATLYPLGPGFVVLGTTGAAVVAREGQLLKTWEAPEGLSYAPSGEALLGLDHRLLALDLGQGEPRWVRGHDGAKLEGPLLVGDEQLLVTTGTSSVRSLQRHTGLERWRFAPQGPQRLHLALQGGRVLVASSGGALHGLDVVEGSLRFRIAAPLPCLAAPIPWGRSAVVALGRGERMGLLVLDPYAGRTRWVREFALAPAAPPLARGTRLRVLGQRDGTPSLLCLRRGGATEWESPLLLGRGPFSLHADEDASLVCAADGSALRVDGQGRVEWRVEGQGGHAVARALFKRGVLLVPGRSVRALDGQSGRVLTEIPCPGGVHALAATETLDVAVLDGAGDLTVWNLGASLGVVDTAVSRI